MGKILAILARLLAMVARVRLWAMLMHFEGPINLEKNQTNHACVFNGAFGEKMTSILTHIL